MEIEKIFLSLDEGHRKAAIALTLCTLIIYSVLFISVDVFFGIRMVHSTSIVSWLVSCLSYLLFCCFHFTNYEFLYFLFCLTLFVFGLSFLANTFCFKLRF